MTVRDYITGQLIAFGVTDATLADIEGVSPDEVYLPSVNGTEVRKAMIPLLERLILLPRQTSVNENGFSVSWDFEGIGKYYAYLCRKEGVKPDKEVLTAAGINTATFMHFNL